MLRLLRVEWPLTAGLVGWSRLMGGLGATLVQMQTHTEPDLAT